MQVQQTPGLAPLPMQMQVPMPVMIQPGMMMVAQAQVPMERADLPGERTVLSQTGGTRLQNTKSIKIEYNAEIRQPGCCEKLALSFATCCCLPLSRVLASFRNSQADNVCVTHGAGCAW